MAERRRLPVVQDPPASSDPDPHNSAAWHWVPLGALASIACGALLSRWLYMPFLQRELARTYGSNATADDVRRLDATLAPSVHHALTLRLAAGGLAVTTFAVLVGAIAVARFGDRTSPRHGALAGIVAMAMLVMFVGRGAGVVAFLTYTLLVPYGGIVGWLGARLAAKRPA